MDDSIFRSKKPDILPRASETKAEAARPAERRIGTPVWKKFVGDADFQRENESAIEAENERVRQSRERRATPSESTTTTTRKRPVMDDPDSLVDDPEWGGDARKAIWKREITGAKSEASDIDFKLQDPSFQARGLSNSERENLEAEAWSLPESDPRRSEIKKRISDSDAYQEEKKRMSQAAYDAKARARQIESMDPEVWWSNRDTSPSVDRSSETVAAAQQKRAAADTADEAAAARMTEIDSKLQAGVRSDEIEGLKAERQEIAEARARIAQERGSAEADIENVRATAAKKLADQEESESREIIAKYIGTGIKAQEIADGTPGTYEKAKGSLNEIGDASRYSSEALLASGGDIDAALSFAEKQVADRSASIEAMTPYAGMNPAAMIEPEATLAGWKSSLQALSAMKAELDAAGVKPEDRARIITDAAKSTAWTEQDEDNVRVLSSGRVVINPGRVFGDRSKMLAAINSSGTSTEDKEDGVRTLDAMREAMAGRVFTKTAYADAKFKKFADKRLKAGVEDKAQILDEWAKITGDRGFVWKSVDAITEGIKYASVWIDKTLVGGAAGAVSLVNPEAGGRMGAVSEQMGQLVESERDAAKLRGITGGYAIASDLTDTVGQMAPMMVGGRIAQGLKGISQTAVGGMSVALMAAAQGYESKLSDAVNMAKEEKGGELTPDEIAEVLRRGDTQLSAVANGFQTAVLARVLGGGAERAALGRMAESMTVRDFITKGGIKALREGGVRKELTALLKTVAADAGDEALEETINQVLDGAISAYGLGEEVRLGDLIEESLKAGLMGGAVGGAMPQISRARMKKSEQEKAVDRIHTAMQAEDPEAAYPSEDEVKRARDIAKPGGARDAAQAVLIERELAEVEKEDAEVVDAAKAELDAAKETGDSAAVTLAEANLEEATRPRAPLVRGVLKIAGGRDLDSLTSEELEAVGLEASDSGFNIVKDRVPMIRPGADGSVVITDTAIREVNAISRRAGIQIGMSETEALEKAAARAKAAAEQSSPEETGNGAQGDPATGDGSRPTGPGQTPASQTVPPHETPASSGELPSWEVPTRSGRVVTVQAPDATAADQEAAATLPHGESILPGRAKQISAPTGSLPDGQTQTPTSRDGGAPSRTDAEKPKDVMEMSRNEFAAYFKRLRERVFAAEKDPGRPLTGEDKAIAAKGWKEFSRHRGYSEDEISDFEELLHLTGGRLSTATANEAFDRLRNNLEPEQTFQKASRRAAKIFDKAKKKLGDRLIRGEARAVTHAGGVTINPERIVREALESGMSESEAVNYFGRVLDEEIRHLAQYDAARILWTAAGKPGDFAEWMESHYAEIWQKDFVATGKADAVRALYAEGNAELENRWDSNEMTDAAKALEAIRIMSQGDSVTEAAKLWLNLSERLAKAIRAALAAMKRLSGAMSPELQSEITNLENALRNIKRTESRGGNPKADSKKPASGRPRAGAGTGGSADGESASRREDDTGGREEPPASFVPGAKVAFRWKGEERTGTVRLAKSGFLSIYPDGSDVSVGPIPEGDARVVEAPKARKPAATENVATEATSDQPADDAQRDQPDDGASTSPMGDDAPAVEAGGWTEERRKEYKRFKRELNKARKAKDWPKVVEVAESALSHFESTGEYPDDWSDFERHRDDAQAEISRPSLTVPITKPLAAPAEPELSEAEKKARAVIDGLFAAPLPDTYDRTIPQDRFMALMDAANSLFGEGVDTPEQLAATMERLAPDRKALPFTQSFWFALKAVGAKGDAEPDWASIYGSTNQDASDALGSETDASHADAPVGDAETDSEVDSENVSQEDVVKALETRKIAGSARRMARAGEKMAKSDFTSQFLSAKEIDEAIELGLAMAAKDIAQSGQSERQTFENLLKVYNNQPKLSEKTSQSKINQAYSTPIPLGWAASRICHVASGEEVFEPSGGHGMLLMETRRDQVVIVNEKDPGRFQRLNMRRDMSKDYWNVLNGDAMDIESVSADRTIGNPPFGQVMGEDGKNLTWQTTMGETSSIDHAIMLKALENMPADGRAVFLIGGPPKTVVSDKGRRDYYGKGKAGALFEHLHANYGVIDHFTVAGELYEKQGAGWPIDVIVIQGKGRSKTNLPSEKSPRMLKTWEEVFQATQLTDEQRIDINRLSEADLTERVGDLAGTLAGIRGASGQGPSGPRSGTGGRSSSPVGTAEETRSDAVEGSPSGDDSRTGIVAGERDPVVESDASDAASGPEQGGDRSGRGEPADGQNRRSVTPEAEGEFQVKYTPFSGATSLDTLIPTNLSAPTADAFDRIKSDLGGDLVGFVRDQLGYPKGTDITKFLAGEQIDAVAAAIWNFQRGGALIVGDQTGIGKGRVVAALMKYAVNQGLVPVFVTQKPGLHNAMFVDDMADIEAGDVKPAIMDSVLKFDAAKKAKLPFGKEYFDAIGRGAGKMTVSQIRDFVSKDGYELVGPGEKSKLVEASGLAAKGSNDWHVLTPGLATTGKGKTAEEAFEHYLSYTGKPHPMGSQSGSASLHGGANAIFVTYDQIGADDAKGLTKKERATFRRNRQAPPDAWRMAALRKIGDKMVILLDESHLASGESSRGYRVRDLLRLTPRAYYSSATSMKRPENAGIYFKTNLGKLTGGNVEEIVGVMNSGGVPAMQAMSAMLAQDGQYLRRERSFKGVEFKTHINEESAERDSELADNLTYALRQIVDVQDAMRRAADAVNEAIARRSKRMNVPAGSRPRLETENFSSKLHNVVSQYLLAIKVRPAAERAIQEIKSGKKVVLAVQNTMESAIDALEAGGFPMNYKGLVLAYLDSMRFFETGQKDANNKPIKFEITGTVPERFRGLPDSDIERNMLRAERDEEGNTRLVVDEESATELLRRAMWDVFVRAREEVDGSDFGDLSISPIDEMRRIVGAAGIRTGEITGRSRGIDENGEIYARESDEKGSQASINAGKGFNDEDLDFLVINQSGSTGISLHASQKAKNQAKRAMMVVQPNLDINEFMQTLGRIHRSGQVTLPEFILFQTALPAEKRPAAILGRKMAMLNANTTSNSKSSVSEGNASADIFNKYGDEVTYRILERDPDLQSQIYPIANKKISDLWDDRTGRMVPLQDGMASLSEEPDGYLSRAITGYLSILPTEEQALFWDKATEEFNSLIDYLNEIGQNDLIAKAIDMRAKTISSEEFTPMTDPGSVFGSASVIEKVSVKTGKEPLTGDAAFKRAAEVVAGREKAKTDYLATADATSKRVIEEKRRRVKSWTDEKEKSLKEDHRIARATIGNSLNSIGRFGIVKREDGTNGLAFVESVKLDESAPLTPSKQIVTLRLNDSRDLLRIPASKMAEAFTIDATTRKEDWDESRDVGGEREIVTGNLLAAMKSLGRTGKVVTYTTDTGETRTGILLPKGFSEKAKAKAARQLKTADAVRDYVRKGGTAYGDKMDVEITHSGENGTIFSLKVDATNRGNPIWRNPALNRMALGSHGFTQRGGQMVATFNDQDFGEIFNRITELGINFSAAKPSSDEDGLESSPLPDPQNLEDHKARARADFAKARPLIENAERQLAAFGSGSLGADPKFANFGSTDKSRSMRDTTRVIDSHLREVRKDADVFRQGLEYLDKHPEDVERLILENGFSTSAERIDDYKQYAIKVFLDRKANDARTDAERAEVYSLSFADIISGREQARAFRMRHDHYQTETERAQAVIAEAIFIPREDVIEQARSIDDPKARREFVRQAGERRIKEVREKVEKQLGLKLEQITGKNRDLQLENSRLMREVMKLKNQIERDVVKLIQKGWTKKDIARRYDKETAEQAQEVLDRTREEIGAKIRRMLANGMTREEIREALKDGLKAAPLPSESGGGMSAAQIDAVVNAMLEEDFGLPVTIPERPLPRTTPKSPKKEKSVPVVDADWSRPEFTDGLSSYTFDTADRSNIMRLVETLRALAQGVGSIGLLDGDKRAKADAALAKINAILSKYGTDAEGIFKAGRPIADYRFDPSDVAQVAAVVRVINAMDADWIDKGMEYAYGSMLSGTQTAAVNALAGIHAVHAATIGRGVEMAMNHALGLVGKSDPMAAQFGELKYVLKVLAPGLKRAWSNMIATWKSQHPMFERDVLAMEIDWEAHLGGALNQTKTGVIRSVQGNLLKRIALLDGDLVRAPMRALSAVDDFNKTLFGMAETAAFAYRLALSDGLKPGTKEFERAVKIEVNTPGSISSRLAAEKAARWIFANALPGQKSYTGEVIPVRDLGDVVGRAAATINKFVTSSDHQSMTAKFYKALLRMSLFPFQRTPFNIIRQSARYAPNPISMFDIVTGIVDNSTAMNAATGKREFGWNMKGRNAELLERMSQQLQGAAALMILMAIGAGDGDEDDYKKPLLITGSQPWTPRNRAEIDARRRAGMEAYRVSFRRKDGSEIAGFSYGRIEPYATAVSSVIDTLAAVKRGERAGKDMSGTLSNVLGSLVAQSKEKTFMQGIGDLTDLVQNLVVADELQEPNNRKVKQFIANRAALAVPNIIRQPIREADTQYRDRTDSFMTELLYQLVPYGQKPAKVDPYGNEERKRGTSASRMFDALDIGTKNDVNPIDRMLIRWRDSGKWAKHPDPDKRKPWFPSPILKATYADPMTGVSVEMNSAQLAEFRKMSGKLFSNAIRAKGINFENPSALDVEKVKSTMSKARSVAKKALSRKFSRENTANPPERKDS